MTTIIRLNCHHFHMYGITTDISLLPPQLEQKVGINLDNDSSHFKHQKQKAVMPLIWSPARIKSHLLHPAPAQLRRGTAQVHTDYPACAGPPSPLNPDKIFSLDYNISVRDKSRLCDTITQRWYYHTDVILRITKYHADVILHFWHSLKIFFYNYSS